VLRDDEISAFVRDGYVAVRRAVGPDIVAACREVIWDRLAARGVSATDRSTWRDPVVRIPCPEGGPFVAAGTGPLLCEAYDQLIGAGRWWPFAGVGGTVPVRFPSRDDPDDAIWHFDAGYAVAGQWRVRVDSRDRGLLALFLFSDVHPDGAPTRLRPGSHLRVPRLLAGAGPEGCEWRPVARAAATATVDLPVELAVGSAGDVFLCHPFLVHAATWPHRGSEPRIMAQPAIGLLAPFALAGPADDLAADVSPVERAILLGLAGAGARPRPTAAPRPVRGRSAVGVGPAQRSV
jgi:hypothetical protein